jgi:hypothetical protein
MRCEPARKRWHAARPERCRRVQFPTRTSLGESRHSPARGDHRHDHSDVLGPFGFRATERGRARELAAIAAEDPDGETLDQILAAVQRPRLFPQTLHTIARKPTAGKLLIPPLPRVCFADHVADMTPQDARGYRMRLTDVAEVHPAVIALVSLLSEGD